MGQTQSEQKSWMWYVLMCMYLLYFMQASLFPGAAIVGQGLIFGILLIGLVNMLRSLGPASPAMPAPLKWIIALLILLTITYILSPKSVHSLRIGRTGTLGQFKDMVAYFVPIFTGFQVGLHKRISPKQWFVVTGIILAVAINAYYTTMQEALQKFNVEQSTNNAGYTFLYVMPFLPLFLRKFKPAAFATLSLVFIFVMLAAKRGAIICMALMLLYAMKWYLGSKMSIKTVIVILLVIAGVYLGVQHFMAENEFLQERLEQTLEGNSSGRDVIYEKLWKTWLEADDMTQLFGRGTAQTVMIAGNYAHNDWLEFLTDNGLLGALLYLTTIVSLFFYRRKIQKGSPMRCAFMIVLLFWFIKSIFSMGMGIMGGISMMLLGTIIGNTVAVRLPKRQPKPKLREIVPQLQYQ